MTKNIKKFKFLPGFGKRSIFGLLTLNLALNRPNYICQNFCDFSCCANSRLEKSKFSSSTPPQDLAGYAYVLQLQEENDCFDNLARDVGRGKASVEELKKQGLSPMFHQLDITDANSIDNLKKFVQEKYGGLDVLVNNAGIAYKVIK